MYVLRRTVWNIRWIVDRYAIPGILNYHAGPTRVIIHASAEYIWQRITVHKV